MSEILFDGKYLKLIRLEAGLVEIQLDRLGDSVNKLDPETVAELDEVTARLRADGGIRGALISSAKPAFLAGADIGIFVDLFAQSEAEIIEFIAGIRNALTRVSDLPFPVVAAVNGYALGGGLELALATDYRVLASDGQVGLPETGIGILPGVGGSVRLPRLVEPALALDWILTARPQKPAAALAAGVVDRVVDPAELHAAALACLHDAVDGKLDWNARRVQRSGGWNIAQDVLAAARAQAQKVAANYPAALHVVELFERTSTMARDEALTAETQAFASLARSPTAKALVGIFIATQQLKKKSRVQAGKGPGVRDAAVLGAGIMGGGIAYASAVRGIPVVLKDISQKALDLGTGEAGKLIAKQVSGGRLKPEQGEAILASIKPQLDFDGFDQVDIVVEAVVENLQLKQGLLGEIESLVRAGTVIASNTSSLAIADIAAPLQRPEDVVGLHFFNPVPVMPLVEVVRGPRTRDEAIASAVGYVLAIGKTPLVVKDCAGFLVNRLLGSYLTAFQQLLNDGADFTQIDRAMEAWGWPMGPAYLIDVVGIDTLDKVLAILGAAYPEVMGTSYVTAISELSKAGRYGQKSGEGFYRYEADARGKPIRSADPAAHELLAASEGATREFGDEAIVDRMMLAMILEAGRCLDEQVVETAIELDAGMRLGAGFPPHRGGPLWYADQIGLAEVLRRAEAHADLGGLYLAGDGLRSLAARDAHYY